MKTALLALIVGAALALPTLDKTERALLPHELHAAPSNADGTGGLKEGKEGKGGKEGTHLQTVATTAACPPAVGHVLLSSSSAPSPRQTWRRQSASCSSSMKSGSSSTPSRRNSSICARSSTRSGLPLAIARCARVVCGATGGWGR